MGDYKLDLSYLKDFNEEFVRAIVMLDPRGNNGHMMEEHKGFIVDASELGIDLLTSLFSVKELGLGLTHTLLIPYLGWEECLWRIQTKGGEDLFNHKRVQENFYEVLGPDGKILGKVTLYLPYRTPFGDVFRELDKYETGLLGGVGDTWGLSKIPFNEWKKSQIESQKYFS